MKLEINKNRSFTACLRDARDFLIDNIETFAQKVWIPALIFSVLIALCVFFRLPNLSLHNWGVSHPWTSWIVQTIIYAGTFISEILYFSSVFNTVNGYGRTRNFGRYLQYFLVSILIDAVFFLVCWGLKNLFTALIGSHPLSHIAHLTILSLYVLICVVLFLLITIPMLYVAPKYMMEKDAKWKQLFRHFSTGFHRWGMLFMTTLLLSIIIGLIMFYTSHASNGFDLSPNIVTNGIVYWRPSEPSGLLSDPLFPCIHHYCTPLFSNDDLYYRNFHLRLWFNKYPEKDQRRNDNKI